MNRQRSFVRKILYVAAIALLLVPLFWLSQPASVDVRGGQAAPGGVLAQLRDKFHLGQAYLGEIDPTSVTIKLVTLGMSGIAADILWHEANTYKMKEDSTNLSATLKPIMKLQPNFIGVWLFQGWNLAYNVSHEFDDYRQRYQWVIKGIDFLKEGIKYNEHQPILQWHVGWYVGHKIGRSDENKQFRKMFRNDDDFHGARPMDQRDNWLVAQEWFQAVEEMVDTHGDTVKGQSPIVYRSNAPMCLMNYAEALEGDGTFGEVAQRAWMNAAAAWKRYGTHEIPAPPHKGMIRLGEKEMYEETVRRATAELDALEPGLPRQMLQEKTARLTPAQRAALGVAAGKRSQEQARLAEEAQGKIRVTPAEIAHRVAGAEHRRALELAAQIAQLQALIDVIEINRGIVNYDYWNRRARMEQTADAVAGHKYLYQGDVAFNNGGLQEALRDYDQGMALWRKILDQEQFQPLLHQRTTEDMLIEVIKHYREILNQLDKPWPKKFIFQDMLDLYEQRKR